MTFVTSTEFTLPKKLHEKGKRRIKFFSDVLHAHALAVIVTLTLFLTNWMHKKYYYWVTD